MCCILKIGLLVRFKDRTNVLYTSDRSAGKVQGWNQCAVILRIGLLVGSRMEPVLYI